MTKYFPIEVLVSSLEWSRRLQAAGWSSPTVFKWKHEISPGGNIWCVTQRPHPNAEQFIAPTAEEILQNLPPFFPGHPKTFLTTYTGKAKKGSPPSFAVVYSSDDGVPKGCQFQWADSYANAAAAMYCYLAANGLLPKA